MNTITETSPGSGQFHTRWAVHTARKPGGGYVTGRPETVAALTKGAKVISEGVVDYYGTREAVERQL